jgi:hypothetical protein
MDQADLFLLMKIPLLAGAEPTSSCFAVVPENVSVLQEILEMSKVDILTWVERDLLAATISSFLYDHDLRTSLRWALRTISEVICSKIVNSSWTNALQKTLSAAFSRAFSISLRGEKIRTTEMLYDACQHLCLTLAANTIGGRMMRS